MDVKRNRLRHAAALLASFSYEKVLERGFAIVQDPAGHLVTSIKALRGGMRLSVRLADGKARCRRRWPPRGAAAAAGAA